MEKLKKLVRQQSPRVTTETSNLMAALSFSPSTPPPAAAAATEQRQQSSNNNMSTSKENAGNAGRQVHMIKTAVTTLGASKPFTKMTVHNVLSESGANALQQHISNQNTIIRKIKDFGIAAAAAAATTTTPTATPPAATAAATAPAATLPRKRPLGVSKSQNEQNKSTPANASKRSKLTAKKLLQQSQNQQKYVGKGNVAKSMASQCPANNAALELLSRPAGTPGRKGLPLPQAVARRNARERNRVKQVNNGFAALRDRIPEEVSEAFEAQGAGRGASKKLSKVETLRMAVEYIRSLERLLGFDFPPFGSGGNSNSSSSSGDDSFMFIKDEFDGLDEQFDDSLSNYEELEESIISLQPEQQPHQQQQPHSQPQQQQQLQLQEEDLLLPNVTTLNGLQYVRIPGTSTYQLLTPDMALLAGTSHQDSSSLDDEHFNALIDTTNCMSPAATAATAGAAATSNGECVKFDSTTLSRSPVPAAAITTSSRSTSPATTIIAATTTAAARGQGSSSLHQPPSNSNRSGSGSGNNNGNSDAAAAKAVAAAAAAVAVAVSPVAVAVANELLLQACAAQQQQHQQQQQQELIKQEYSEGDFVHVTNNNNNSSPPTLHDYQHHQQHQQQQQQQQHQLLCSPILPAFYDQEPTSFYDNVHVRLPSFKKEFSDVLQDQTTTATGATTANSICLSDESMIDAIDWWEAHTPKSDVGTIAGM